MVITMEVTSESMRYEIEASLIWNAKRELRTMLLRVLEIIARFGQFKVRELVSIGFRLKYNVDTEVGENHVRVTIDIYLPRDFVVEYAKNYSLYARMINRIMRIGKHNENVKYSFVDFSREHGFLMEDLEKELYGEEGSAAVGGSGDEGSDVHVVLEEPSESVIRATMEEIKSGSLGELVEMDDGGDQGGGHGRGD